MNITWPKRVCLLIALFLAASPMLAQYPVGERVVISQPIWHDLYVMGGTVLVEAPVHGDLVVAGGTVVVNDSITGDILVAGGRLTFNGYAGDDIRCAGGEIMVLKHVAGDLVVLGGTVHVEKTVSVGGILATGGSVELDGQVVGDVKIISGELVFNGRIGRSLDCRAGDMTLNGMVAGASRLSATGKIRIGATAQFNGPVRYWVPGKNTIDFGQSAGSAVPVFDPGLAIHYGRWYFLGFATVIGLLWYVGMALLMIAIVQWLLGTQIRQAVKTATQSPGRCLGYGILYWIAVPVVVVLSFVTVVGVPVGILLLLLYVASVLLATVLVSVMAANWFRTGSERPWGYWRLVFTALLLFVVLKVITATPLLGWVILLLLSSLSFGALISIVSRKKHPAIKTSQTGAVPGG